jgi:hypothetical protein
MIDRGSIVERGPNTTEMQILRIVDETVCHELIHPIIHWGL